MKTSHIVKRSTNFLASGTATTEDNQAAVSVSHLHDGDGIIRVDIDGQWMNTAELRQTAKFLKKLADVLDAQ